jgi:CRP-like cAMP-binding protein
MPHWCESAEMPRPLPGKSESPARFGRAASPGESGPQDLRRAPGVPQANRLLGALDPADFGLLLPHLQVVELPPAHVLYEPGEAISYAYFPQDCMVSLVAVLEEGATAEVAVFGCEGVVGFISSLVSRISFGRYVVQIPGYAARIPLARLREAVDSSPSLRDIFARYTEALLAQTFQTVACNAVHTVEARCCRWILSTYDRAGRKDLPLTHDFLAEMLGVQRSTVSLITRTLQANALIRQGRGMISIVDQHGLEEVACDCYRTIRRSFERLLPNTYRCVSPSAD